MKKAAAPTLRLRDAVQGFACRCAACLGDPSVLYPNSMYCERCGHAYMDLRTGRPDDAKQGCNKCGAVGQFVDEKPVLPMPALAEFMVRVRRQVSQTVVIAVSARTTAEAAAQALDAAQASTAWRSDGDAGLVMFDELVATAAVTA